MVIDLVAVSLRKALASLLLIAMPLTGYANSQEMFGGSLGVWLSGEAQSELTKLLSAHPRFRGERISVVAMRDGLPASHSDELTQAIRSQLTHRLAKVQGVQLAWRAATTGCAVPRETPYLLGVEVEAEGRNRHLVRIAMVDVNEGIWVNGAHLQWRGILTSEERRAQNTSSIDGASGSIDKPLAASDRVAILEQLIQGIECTLALSVEGRVEIVAADDADVLLNELASSLRKQMVHSAKVSVAANHQSADWQLQLALTQDLGQSVVATLTAIENGELDSSSVQRLAAVYVRGAAGVEPARVAAGSTPVGPEQSLQRGADLDLITNMRAAELGPGDPCYRPSGNCLEVEFELAQPGYVLVLSNDGGLLHLGSCKRAGKIDGLRRYRVRKGRSGQGRGELSVYALATQDAVVARTLHELLSAQAVNCGGGGGATDAWLNAIDQLTTDAPGKVHWQAFYESSNHDRPAITARTPRHQDRGSRP